jgi:hypothetical protein
MLEPRNRSAGSYASAKGIFRAERDISSDLRGALPPSTPWRHASETAAEGVAAM